MSPTIRVDGEVYKLLQDQAEPFVDTPNAVLRRVLGLPIQQALGLLDEVDTSESGRMPISRRPQAKKSASSANKHKRVKKGSILPETEYEIPLLQTLADLGGRAATREVLDALAPKIQSKLTPGDIAMLPTGGIRWENRAQFVRLRLIEGDYMRKGSPRGIWEISEKGRQRLSSL